MSNGFFIDIINIVFLQFVIFNLFYRILIRFLMVEFFKGLFTKQITDHHLTIEIIARMTGRQLTSISTAISAYYNL